MAGPGSAASEACLEPFLQAWNELEGGDEASVLDVLRSAAERHRELVTEAGLEEDTPADWKERTELLLGYRRGVDTDVLTPLSQAYQARGPATTIDGTMREASEKARELSRALPEIVGAPFPEGALTPETSDTFGRRVGKAVARVISGARRAGRERSLPLRNVTLHHLVSTVAPGQDDSGCAALVAWARWSQRLELAWIEWGTVVLPALVQAEIPSDEAEQAAELWVAIRQAALALQGGLETLLEEEPGPELAAAARVRLDEARAQLEADLAVAGSFLLNPSSPPGRGLSLPRMTRLAPPLREWDLQVNARIRLHMSLLAILSGATAVQRRMVWRFRERCLSGIPVLGEIADRLASMARSFGSDDDSFESRLAGLGARVEEALQPTSGAIPEPHVVDSAVREISDSTIEALTAMIRQAPTELALHAPSAKVPTGARSPEARILPLQELARQSFDALRIERIRSATSGLLEAVDAARTNVSDLGDVYAFARDEVTKELESDEEGSEDRAKDLVEGALSSAAESLRTQVANLDAAVEGAQDRLASEISEGSMALVDRVGAGRMEARLFAARSRFADLWSWLTRELGPPAERAWRHVSLRLNRLRRLGRRVMRKGSEMVGSAPAETAASARTLRALSDPNAARNGVPLVYQRLFTLDPIADPALLAGRDSELTAAMQRWKRWRDADGEGVPIVVRGRQGSGVTSFLNVLQAQIESDGGSIQRLPFEERVTSEGALAAQLAAPLGLEPPDSLDELAAAVFDADPDSLPAAVALDNLEHLYLRVPNGTDLMERLLTLMAETEPRVLWIGGITASAWQLVSTSEPTAISQVDVFDLSPLSAPDLHAAVNVRHRRSGLAIRYEEATSARQRLRRRLRRMRNTEGYRGELEDDYFGQLHKVSGGHLGLALHQWLVSADFSSGEGVFMRQPDRPDFSILETLDLRQNFTLKAFLEHRSLTLDEHDRIFRVSRKESYQVFESLRNRLVIEPWCRDDDELDKRSEIEEELRYRIRPLLTGAVIEHLRGRNIVH